MKRSGLWSLGVLALVALCGCAKPYENEAVIGPDLSHDGPFKAAHQVVLTQAFTYYATGFPEAARTRRITLTPGAQADTAELINVFTSTEKPFLAGVSYRTFTPIVAETNDTARTYWLVGFNATRTPDRSTYMVLRYPRILKIVPGLSSDAFEYASLECGDLTVARRPADYYKPRPEGAKAPDEPKPDPAPEAAPCEFNSVAEAEKMTLLALKRYDEIKHYDGAPSLDWQQVHIEVK